MWKPPIPHRADPKKEGHTVPALHPTRAHPPRSSVIKTAPTKSPGEIRPVQFPCHSPEKRAPTATFHDADASAQDIGLTVVICE